MIRKIAANYIFPVSGKPIKNGVLVYDDTDGTIIDLVDNHGEMKEIASLEFHSGVLVPGFVNCHCHLELSYLRKKVEPHTGLPGFLIALSEIRKTDTDPQTLALAIEKADKLMQAYGIKAVGDICNTPFTFQTKQNSKLKYHNFVELFGLSPQKAPASIEWGSYLWNELKNKHLPASITPHAPYSASVELLAFIRQHAEQHQSTQSIHNQETESENEMFRTASGALWNSILARNIQTDAFRITGQNSLPSIINHLAKIKTLLVHNTFTQKQDIEAATAYWTDLYWILCPGANLFIENRLPDIELFRICGQKIALGTDSLASNTTLSILEEMKILTQHHPHIPFTELLQWATLNGANALGYQSLLGSFEKGKKPGILLIENFDFRQMSLRPDSFLRVMQY